MYNTSVIMDWYSFTTRLKTPLDNPETMLEVASNSIRYAIGDYIYNAIFNVDGWELGGGRRPYKGGYIHSENGVRVWFGGQSTVLVEFSGKGCETLRKHGLVQALIASTWERCTRIDIAVDIDSGGLVDEIADSVGNARIKTSGRNNSPTGVTRYIGSRKSEKMVRVYEYYDPHPRAGSTRVEYEHKKQQARVTASYMVHYDAAHVADMISKIYDWRHEAMSIRNVVEKMPSPVSDARTDAKTISWIMRQVAPAIKRLISDGKISEPEKWLLDTFMPPKIGDVDGNTQKASFELEED